MKDSASLAACNRIYSGRILDTWIPKNWEFTLYISRGGDWRKLHNEEPHNFLSSPNIIRMIKSRKMRWAGHVARMGEDCI
jgi:hypothetical protein